MKRVWHFYNSACQITNVYVIEFNDKVEEKEGFIENFKTSAKKLKAKYAHGSEFCKQLEAAYDKDLEVHALYWYSSLLLRWFCYI